MTAAIKPASHSIEPVSASRRNKWQILAILLAFTVLVAVIGWLTFRNMRIYSREEISRTLSVIADQKRQQIEKWLSYNRMDAEVYFSDRQFQMLLSPGPDGGLQNPAVLSHIKSRLEEVAVLHSWNGIAIFDAQGHRLFSVGEADVAEHSDAVGEVLQNPQVRIIDLHRETNGVINYCLLLPISGTGGTFKGVAYVSLQADQTLFSMVESWPVPTQSAETYLVRRDGNQLLFLTPLRFEPDAALKKRVSLQSSRMPAARAVSGERGIIADALDYRSVPVLAFATAIEGTPWLMIAEIDQKEAFAGIHMVALVVSLVMGFVLLLSYAVAFFLWRRDRHQRALAALQAQQAAEKRFRVIFEESPLGVALVDSRSNRIVETNRRFAAIIGFSEEDVPGINLAQITHPDDQLMESAYLKQMKSGEIPSFQMDKRFRRRDGAVAWVHQTVAPMTVLKNGTPNSLYLVEDISERKQLEASLRSTQERVIMSAQTALHLTEHIPVGIFALKKDADGHPRFTFLSEQLLKMLDRDLEELAVNPLMGFDRIHPDEQDEFNRLMTDSFAMNSPIRWEGRLVIRGEIKWYSIESITRELKDGGAIWEGVIIDITARKKADEQLRLTEQKTRNILDNSPVAICIISLEPDGRLIYLNEQFVHNFGYTLEDIPTKVEWCKYAFPNEEYRQAYQDWNEQALARALEKKGGIESKNFHLTCKDGEMRDMIMSISVLEDQLLCTFVNITELMRQQAAKQAVEAKFKRLIELAPIPLGLMDRDGSIQMFNDQFVNTFGYSSKDTPTQQGWLEVALPDKTYRRQIIGQWRKAVGEATETHGRIGPIEIEILCKDGEHRTIEMSGIEMEDSFLGAFVDVTERQQAARMLQQALEHLNEAQRAAHLGSWVSDRLEKSQWWSEELYRLFDLDPDTSKAAAEKYFWEQFIHPEDRESILSQIEKTLARREKIHLRFRGLRPDGQMRYFEVLGDAEYAPDGAVCKIHGTIQDISERVEAEEKLRMSEQRHRMLANNAIDIISTMNLYGELTYLSPSVEKLRGFTVEEALRQPAKEALTPESFALWKKYTLQLNEQWRAGQSMESFQGEFEFYRKDGSTVWTEAFISPVVDAEGNLVEMMGVLRDISERKLAESTLAAQQGRLQALLDNTTNLIWLIDADARLIIANSAYKELYQKITGREMLPGLDMPNAFSNKKYQQFAKEVYSRVLSGERTSLQQPGILHPETIVEYTFNPIRDDDGQVIGAACSAHDITHLKTIDEELKSTKDYLEATIRALPDLLFRMDGEGRILDSYSSKVNDLYLPPGQFLGKTVFEVLPETAANIMMAAIREAADTGQHHGAVYSLQMPSGIAWYELSIAAMSKPVRPDTHFIILARDITERQEAEDALHMAEERYVRAVRGTSDGLWDWNLVTGEEYHSPRYQELLGYEAGEMDNTLKAFRSHVHPEDLPKVLAAQQSHLEENAPYDVDLRMRTRSGEYRWFNSRGQAERDANGRPLSMAGAITDITERKQAEEALVIAKEQAEAANRAKSEFLANMSHEIRTPMNAVLGLAQLLEKESLSSDQHDMVQRIRMAGRSLLGIINDILDLSKIEAGQLRIEEKPFTLKPILDHLEYLQGELARNKGLAFHITLPDSPLGQLSGDSLRLEQILFNLTSNAIKFTSKGEIQVRVLTLNKNGKTVLLRFEISDTGLGIEPEFLADLFKPFTQADGSISRRYGGTGLGLSICKRLVDLMGGRIGAESRLGVGSTFWFEIKFQRTSQIEKEPEPTNQKGTGMGPLLKGRRFLVVDDSDVNQELVKMALAMEGAEAVIAGDGQQALEALRKSPEFDAVLMDIQMPVMDGLAATRAIRHELGLTKLPIIAFTAGVFNEDRERALEAGINDFLPKPVDLEKMFALLLQWSDLDPGKSRQAGKKG